MRGECSAIGIDDEQAFAIHLVIAVDQPLQRTVGHRGDVGQCSELAVPFRGERRGPAVGQSQRQGDRKGRNCKQGEDHQDDPDS